jgi:hypothetical protein
MSFVVNPFFIVSLPRSRTAWLANFLSYGPCYCYHEPMCDFDLKDYPHMLALAGTPYAGVADSINCMIIDKLIKMFPRAKLVIIRRDIGEVARSVEAAFHLKCMSTLEKMNRELDRIENTYEGLVVPYHDFSAAKIWHYLLGNNMHLNEQRLAMLENFNITVPVEVNFRKAIQLTKRAGDFIWPLFT